MSLGHCFFVGRYGCGRGAGRGAQKFSADAADAELFIAIRRYEWLVRGLSA